MPGSVPINQKEDLVRQTALLSRFRTVNGWQHEIIQNLGSGLNYGKEGLKQVIRKICHGEINRLVVTYKDRLLRLGSELMFALL